MRKFMTRDNIQHNFMNRIPEDIKLNYPFMIRDSFNNRISQDHYPTPINTIYTLLNNIDITEKNILEPSAGAGNFIKAMRNNGIDSNITAIEYRHTELDSLKQIANNVYIGDFLSLETDNKFDLIIGNPPFSKALEFIEKCFDLLTDDGRIIMLLRTAFLESKQRYDFWQRHPLSGLYVLSSRPSFTGKGTDAQSYSFFVFYKNPKNKQQEIKIIL